MRLDGRMSMAVTGRKWSWREGRIKDESQTLA